MPDRTDWMSRLRASLREPDLLRPAEAVADGPSAEAEAWPTTPEQVAQTLAFAAAEGLTVLPVGGGTALHVGNALRRVDLLLHTTSLAGGVEHGPEDLVATVPAGMSVAAANAELAPAGQALPLDAAWPERATVGGFLATAPAGPRAERYGHPRDSVLGLRVALPTGDVVRMGGRVVKNVTGYDLAKLHIGSLGTLGVILEATFKLTPLPEATATSLHSFLTLDEALRAASDIRRKNLEPLALAVANGEAVADLDLPSHPAHLLVEFGDLEAVVQRQLREAAEAAEVRDAVEGEVVRGKGSRERWEALKPLPSTWDVTFRATVPPAAVDPYLHAAVEAAEGEGRRPAALAYPGRGVVYVGLPAADDPSLVSDLFKELAALAQSLGGYALLERGPPPVKQDVDVWGTPPPALPLMRRIRMAFDPAGTLVPARYLGEL